MRCLLTRLTCVCLFSFAFACSESAREEADAVDSGSDASAGEACAQFTDAGDRYCCGRASELPGISCIDRDQDGGEFGTYGRCREVGEAFERKIVGARCCEGAKPSRMYSVVMRSADNPAGCLEQGPPSLAVCLACGDGVCDGQENRCNCKDDCK